MAKCFATLLLLRRIHGTQHSALALYQQLLIVKALQPRQFVGCLRGTASSCIMALAKSY